MPGDARLTPLEEDLLAALDTGEIARHRARLGELGRGSGERGQRGQRDRAAAYIRATVRGWELPLTLHRFEAAVSLPREAYLSLARRDAPVAAIAHPYSSATPPSGLISELRVAVAGEDLAGCVALVDGPPTPAGVAALAARGAIGQVYISPDETLRPAAVAVGGTTICTPVISIGRSAGEGFLALCAGGPTPVQLRAEVERRSRRLTLPVATVAGVEEPDSFVLVGVAFGPADTGGAAVLLELCRVLAQGAGRLRRGLRLAWWPGEAAPGAAAAWYAGQSWEALGRGAVAYVELSEPGAANGQGEPSHEGGGFALGASPTLRWFGEAALGDGGVDRARWLGAAPPIHAAPFAGLGIPFLALAPADSARPGQPGDTAAEDRDNGADLAALGRRAALHLLLLARLCTYPALPFDTPALARAIAARLQELAAQAGDLPELAPLPGRAAACRAAADRLQLAALHVAQAEATGYEEGLELVNRALRRHNRLLVPLLHRAGDRYASPVVSPDLLPGIEGAVALTAPATAGEAIPWSRATLMAERNRLVDALNEAAAICDEALDALRALGIS
jgi:hypothetical protein